MTLHERLAATGLFAEWDAALASGDRDRIIDILKRVEAGPYFDQLADEALKNYENGAN